MSDRTADPMGMHNPASVRSLSQSQGNTPPLEVGSLRPFHVSGQARLFSLVFSFGDEGT